MADLSSETRDAVREGVKRSAGVVLPIVFDYLGTPASLLDVGAGEGHWGIEAEQRGIHYVRMLDLRPWMGIYNDDYGSHRYDVEAWDAEARTPLPLRDAGDHWPLALCLEMAEHVSPAAGDHLVAELCRVSDFVLFSAAVPGQGGDGHVNEQWPDYWSERFNHNDFELLDPFRSRIWDDDRIEPWYRQNLLLARPLTWEPKAPMALVHPVTWAYHRGVNPPGLV